MTIKGTFIFSEKYNNWLIFDKEDFDLEILEITGTQKNKVPKNGKKTIVVVSDDGKEYFLSNKQMLESNGKCKFNAYKLYKMESLAACNLKPL